MLTIGHRYYLSDAKTATGEYMGCINNSQTFCKIEGKHNFTIVNGLLMFGFNPNFEEVK